MDVDEVAFLACGWSLASSAAHAMSIALRAEDEVILVDAGGQATKGLVDAYGSDALRHVYLTHEHPDHTYALPGLIHHLRFAGERESLTVHGPSGALKRVRQAIGALGVTHPYDVEWDALKPEKGSNSQASWAPSDHTVPTLSYRFGDVIVCGDTAPSQEVKDLAMDGSLLVHEATHSDEGRTHDAGHSTPRDAGRIASEASVEALAIVHIHPSMDRQEALDQVSFDPAFAPVDGDVISKEGGEWHHRSTR